MCRAVLISGRFGCMDLAFLAVISAAVVTGLVLVVGCMRALRVLSLGVTW